MPSTGLHPGNPYRMPLTTPPGRPLQSQSVYLSAASYREALCESHSACSVQSQRWAGRTLSESPHLHRIPGCQMPGLGGRAAEPVKLAKGHALERGQLRTRHSEQNQVGGQKGVRICRHLKMTQIEIICNESVLNKSCIHRKCFRKYKTDSGILCVTSARAVPTSRTVRQV